MSTPATTILVVEDNPTTRKMLRMTLETEGYAVVEAADARTALDAAAVQLPSLVLQDLVLPDMDGLVLVRQLRSLPGGAELPIVALSGFLGSFEGSPSAAGGFTASLVKPIEPGRLIETIRTYLPSSREPLTDIGQGRHLLVVDDDPLQLKLARLHFLRHGFVVTAAGRAADALLAARAHRPDVVVSDVFMPDVDGFQLCLDIRQDRNLAHLPVVLVSATYGTEADQDLARRVGASALVLRTPDFGHALRAIDAALEAQARAPDGPPSDQLKLQHAQTVIEQLERQTRNTSGLARRCALQAAQLSLLSGVADALARESDTEIALRDVLAATLDAAGISKGALAVRDGSGALGLRQCIGFSEIERQQLEHFFGHRALLESIVEGGGNVCIPSPEIPEDQARSILAGADVATMQIVPLVSGGRGVGAVIVGARHADVTSDDSVAFARAMGNQIVQSLELTRSVARLAASEQRYRTLLESANDCIAVLTPHGVVREMNRRWVEMSGLSREQLIGRHIRDFAAPGMEDEVERMYTGALAPNAPRPPAVEIATIDGSTVLMECSSTRVEVAGEPLLFTVSRDVTEQRRLEEQLHQAQKLEAIGQLAGGVAHDFNNVLTAILGFSELLLSGLDEDAPARKDLLEIKKAGERAANLTRQLLAFGRKQILQPRVLDINEIVAGMEPMLKRLIFEHIELTLSLTPALGLIRMDPTQLEQILVNLVVNAADAMPRGGKLTIETASLTLDEHDQKRRFPVTPGAHVMLSVRDTGIGMDEATIRHIFEPFFTTKGVGKGTGLGLATVYGIVKQSGGDIRVESEVGRGTTFKIYLPEATAVVPGGAERLEVADVPSGSETILLVEDDAAVRTLARVTLERNGYRVLQAENPKDAMRVVGDFHGAVHLLVSDVIMPESEGPPLFERVAQLHRGLRVLFMSGYADETVATRGMFVEGAAFLQKPFTPRALAQKVRDVLEGRR